MAVSEFTEGSYRMQNPDFFFERNSAKYDLLEIYEIFNVTNSTNLGCQMWLQ